MECSIKYRDGGHKQWVCTCPAGSIFHSHGIENLQNDVISWDGCGPPEWGDGIYLLNTFLIPDVLQPCCNAHDVCFTTMYHGENGITELSELKKKYKEFNVLDWGVCDDVFQKCNKSKVGSVPWYDIPKKAWVSFAGHVMSSAVIENAADYHKKLDDDGNTIWTREWCVKKTEGLCIYD